MDSPHICVFLSHVLQSISAILFGPQAERIENIPLDEQFPACAIEAGRGPTRGNDTGNDAEVEWPMMRGARREKDQYKCCTAALTVVNYQRERSLKLWRRSGPNPSPLELASSPRTHEQLSVG